MSLQLLRPPSALALLRRRPSVPTMPRSRRSVSLAASSPSPGPGGRSSPSPPSPRSPTPTPLARSPSPPSKPSSSSSSSFSRLREIEVLHARWAMLGVAGVIFSDSAALFSPTAWREALDAASSSAPGTALAAAALATLAVLEAARFWGSGEKDAEQRAYPATTARGNRLFDPLGLFRSSASAAPSSSPSGRQLLDASRAVYAPWLFRAPLLAASESPPRGASRKDNNTLTRAELRSLQWRELAAGRTAMAAFAGVAAASGLTGRGPLTLLAEHLADPQHATVVRTLLLTAAEQGAGDAVVR